MNILPTGLHIKVCIGFLLSVFTQACVCIMSTGEVIYFFCRYSCGSSSILVGVDYKALYVYLKAYCCFSFTYPEQVYVLYCGCKWLMSVYL